MLREPWQNWRKQLEVVCYRGVNVDDQAGGERLLADFVLAAH